MSWKKSLIVIIVFQLLAALLIYSIIEKVSRIGYSEKNVFEFSGFFPDGDYQTIKNNNWEGLSFRGGLRLFWQESSDPLSLLEKVREKNLLRGYEYLLSLPLGRKGLVAFGKRHKGYYLVVLAAIEDRLFWIDLLSSGSIDIGFNYLGKFLNSLHYRGKALRLKDLAEDWKKFRQQIPFSSMQSVSTFFLFIFSIFGVVLVIIYVIFSLSGSKPAEVDPLWELITPQVTVKQRKMIGYRSFPACLAKRGDELLLFRFKKLYQTIKISEQREKLRFVRRILELKDFQIVFPDEQSADNWRVILT